MSELTTTRLEVIEGEIRTLLRRATDDVLKIGILLLEANDLIPHGEWLLYLDSIGITPRMAQHWMNVARRFMGKNEKFSHIPATALIILAAPSTPQTAIDEVEQRLDADEALSLDSVESIVHQHQAVKALAQATQTIIDTKPDKTSMESHVKSMSVVTQEMTQTGAVDLDNGEMAHLGQVVGQAAQVETERRRQEYIAQSNPKPQYDTIIWRKQIAVGNVANLFEQLDPSELIYVTVEVRKV